MEMFKHYWQLMRFHKPIGIFLLLWPTLWALWIAARGVPNIKNLIIFVTGVIVMRAAGCVINDYADRYFDAHITRTQLRPIATGKISAKNALVVFFILCTLAFLLVLYTNRLTILLSLFAVIVASLYPFTKRITYWPQLVLGIAFSFSVPMAFAAQMNHLPPLAGLLMLTTILWTVAYDTEYAMVDRNDDLKIGIKSTAILFGKHDCIIIAFLQSTVVGLLCWIGVLLHFSFIYYGALLLSSSFFIYQQVLLAQRKPEKCFHAFLNNHWVGCVIFLGVFFSFK